MADAGAPVSVTVGSISGTGGLYGAQGIGATFVDQSSADNGEAYAVQSGGLFELAAPPVAGSSLGFDSGGGTIALEDPAASNAVAIVNLTAGDTLQVPGSSVSSVTGIGTNTLSITTNAGTYVFSNVTDAANAAPTGYTPSHDQHHRS